MFRDYYPLPFPAHVCENKRVVSQTETQQLPMWLQRSRGESSGAFRKHGLLRRESQPQALAKSITMLTGLLLYLANPCSLQIQTAVRTSGERANVLAKQGQPMPLLGINDFAQMKCNQSKLFQPITSDCSVYGHLWYALHITWISPDSTD